MAIKNNILPVLIGTVVVIGIKILYIPITTEQLHYWLLPINKLLELFTGASSEWVSEKGYYYGAFDILIEKSCSGVNYWLMCTVVLYFLILKHYSSYIVKCLAFPILLLVSYMMTILVNATRIYSYLLVINGINFPQGLNSHVVHEAIGVIVYLFFLILIYLTTNTLLNKTYAKNS